MSKRQYIRRGVQQQEPQPHIFDLYQKPLFDNTIRKEEFRTYTPYIKSFNNSDVVEFIINQSDAFFAIHETLLEIKGSIEKVGDGVVSLAPNAGAFLFDTCTYIQSSHDMEIVRDPGVVSTIRSLLCYTPEDSKFLSTAGWNYPNNPHISGDNFSLLIPIKHIFNIFNDYNKLTYGRQVFRFVRARNDRDCILMKEPNATTTTTVSLTVTSMELKVKHVFPNDDMKIELMTPIKNNVPITIPFRKWELNELPSLTSGSRREIWSVKTTSSVERPRYVIVAFQTSKRDDIHANPTLFDHIRMSSVRLVINGEYWPNERMQLDFAKNDYAIAHYNYTEFFPSYTLSSTKHPILDYVAFKKYALFVFDCSKQDDTSFRSGTVDVKLEIEADSGFPAGTRAYCLIVHDSLLEYFPLTEVIKNII
ncbi:uncharacterized protein LOC126890198 [Diabrotica virgifera virgifera]|uniref:Double jelly roll-like domain-containing protein n=1 Tax=Diabrotica virgifera virgifera TaxID=50390 RepID=A0ABM5KG52_DIAVI|nr:uncharacterized protein LOC126882710 [Diabrotica virgifera virgifera]XP_050509172.1 uncharacterized protein LOC126886341 [Diabrotica virgifera virgifera]XP_050515008.1 uncharacterized protein LOC126890198 [Diabrotica virgifera virgifera]